MTRILPLLLLAVLGLAGCDDSNGGASALTNSGSTDWTRPVPGDDASLLRCKDSLLARMAAIHSLPVLRPVQASWVARAHLPALLDSIAAVYGSGSSTDTFTYDRLCYALGYTSAPGEYDSASSSFSSSQTLGFYVDSSDHLWVVTDATSDSAQLINTLSHELTHALQDQHFDLRAHKRAAHTTDAHQALTFLIEGDASYAATLFQYGNPSLTWIDRSLRFKGLSDARTYIASTPKLSAMPLVATLPSLAPYFRGAGLVHEIREAGDWALVDSFLNRPLTTTRNCLIPSTGIQRTSSQAFDSSHAFPLLAGQGWTPLGYTRLGSVMINTLFLTRLAEHDGLLSGISASLYGFDAWNGDRVWIWRKGGDYTVALVVAASDVGSASSFKRNWDLATSGVSPTQWTSHRHGRSILSGTNVLLSWTTGEDTAAGAAMADLATLGTPTIAAGRAAAIDYPRLPLPPERPVPPLHF
jgi:hypothetical protein